MLVTKLVNTETDVFRRLVDSAVDSAVDSTFGASENFSFQPQVSKSVSTETMVFWIGTHSPGTQPGTHGKAAFAGAENLSKPYLQNLKKPETQDAAKPYIRWCTRA